MNKIVRRHIELIGVLFLYVLVMYITGIGCPFRFVTGIPCPGCGLTRAYVSVLHGQFHQAFLYHPLFLLAPILIWAGIHSGTGFLKKIGQKKVNVFIVLGCALFIAVYLLRMWKHWII